MKLKIFTFIIAFLFHTSLLNAGSINVKLNRLVSIITANKISPFVYASGILTALACVGFFAKEPSNHKEKVVTFGGFGVLTLIASAATYKFLSKRHRHCAFLIMPTLLLLFPYALQIKKDSGINLTFFEKLITGFFLANCLNIIPQACGIAAAYTFNKLSTVTGD